jgi:RimJ/RimL family protein N-acetyltransferase
VTIETARLRIRDLTSADAPFIVSLLNDPAFLRFIGDRGVRSLDDAVAYIARGPAASYERHGFGLGAVDALATGEPMGICGLLQRDELEAPDLGFAFLPPFRDRGLAREAAAAVLEDASRRLRIPRVLAITQPDNTASIALLERLAFRFERTIPSSRTDVELSLYARALEMNPGETTCSVLD